jgi:molybdate transport system substrate-binding protein
VSTIYPVKHRVVIGTVAAVTALWVVGIPLWGMVSRSRVVLRVAAASDLSRAFRELAPLFERETGSKVTLIFGSTGLLAKQAENAAPFDVLAAADESYVEKLEAAGVILPGSRTLYAVGRLVIWTRPGKPQVTSVPALADSRVVNVSIANPRHAPYGRAAEQALKRAGIWERVRPKLVFGENVSQAMQLAQSGNSDVGVIALSLVKGGNGSYSLVPESMHTPLRQAMGILSRTDNAELAEKFAEFVNGPRGRPIMRRFGFTLPGERIR